MRFLPTLSVCALCLALAVPARAVTLYDAAAGTLPTAQGWSALQFGASPLHTLTGGAYRLDTTGAGVGLFGHALVSPMPLDTVTGFDMNFELRLPNELHASQNRAGYSVLVTGSDARQSLEIAFWSGSVWIYDFDATHPDRLVHGAGAAIDTAVRHDYRLAVRAGRFTLSADGTPLLAGALRDYTAAGAPYTMPNGLFFGDNTTRGASISELIVVHLAPVPEPGTALMFVAGVLGLGWRRIAARVAPAG